MDLDWFCIATLMTYLLKKERAEKQLFAWQKKGKRQPAREKSPRTKKKDR